eukprot:4308541-Prymnesium_polylepis.1
MEGSCQSLAGQRRRYSASTRLAVDHSSDVGFQGEYKARERTNRRHVEGEAIVGSILTRLSRVLTSSGGSTSGGEGG